jgi:SAM-dependent methyltransferase
VTGVPTLCLAFLFAAAASPVAAQIRMIQASPVAPDPLRGPIIGNPLSLEGPTGLMPLLQSKPAGDARYQPQVGQDGKDVIWVPTPDSLIKAMLTTAQVTPRDMVVDLGSGDGRIAIAAARDFGARAHGIEYNPDMVMLALRTAVKEGVGTKVTFETADIFQSDFSRATVVTLYLLPSLNLKLRDTLLKMKPGTRVVSHAFDMGDWTPDQTITTDDATGFFWVVPADAAGRWAFEIGNERFVTTLTQRFQMLDAGPGSPVTEGRLRGTSISLSRANGATLQGEVSSGMMVGPGWMATRIRAAE